MQGPHAFLRTSGLDVGLPPGQMGNSEVGHLNIGAGRVVMQELPRIYQAIEDGSLARNPALAQLIATLRGTGGTCHLMGLVSPGGVHAHQDHAVALARILAEARVPTVVHAFTDGRDTPPQSGGEDIQRLLAALPGGVRIGTVCGRYYAMDRDHRWDRVERAYLAMAEGRGASFADAASAIDDAHGKGVTDEFIAPRHHRRLCGHEGRRRHPVVQLPRRPHPRDPGAAAGPGLRRLCPPAPGAARRRHRHDPLQRRAGAVHAGAVRAANHGRVCWARSSRPTAAASCGWRKPRSTRTSLIS